MILDFFTELHSTHHNAIIVIISELVFVLTYRVTFDAALRVLLFVTTHTDDFLITWYEASISDWLLADFAAEALFVPLFRLVFKFFHS